MNLSFYKFSVQVNDEVDLETIHYAGIFGVECNVNNRIIILGSECLLFSMRTFFENVLNGSINNKELLNDLQTYGKEAFTFFVFDADFELETKLKREKPLNYYKNLYKGKLYE